MQICRREVPISVVKKVISKLKTQTMSNKKNLYQMQECPICYDEIKASKCTVFQCGHLVCTECATQIKKLICPVGKCTKKIQEIQNGFQDIKSDKIYFDRDENYQILDDKYIKLMQNEDNYNSSITIEQQEFQDEYAKYIKKEKEEQTDNSRQVYLNAQVFEMK